MQDNATSDPWEEVPQLQSRIVPVTVQIPSHPCFSKQKMGPCNDTKRGIA